VALLFLRNFFSYDTPVAMYGTNKDYLSYIIWNLDLFSSDESQNYMSVHIDRKSGRQNKD
jgi:hypothetical protein